MQVLFKFLYLLDQSMLDIAEEAELAKHKANIVKEIRHNQQLEQEMNEMDIKIGEQGILQTSAVVLVMPGYFLNARSIIRALITFNVK